MVRGFTMDEKTTALPDVGDAVGGLQSRLRSRLTKSAKARTLAELMPFLAIHGSPLLAAFGAINADDYIGAGVATVTYQQLLNAAEAGVPFKLELANADEAVKYVIDGRFHIR
jgi:hypothetical protein